MLLDEIDEVVHLLKVLVKQGEVIMKSQAELAQQLRDISTTLNQVAVEEDAMQATIVTLNTALANQPAVTDDLQAAADALTAQAATMAAIVPAPVTPPTDPPVDTGS